MAFSPLNLSANRTARLVKENKTPVYTSESKVTKPKGK